MNKKIGFSLLGVFFICLLLVGSVSGYYCIYQEDNDAVKQFKSDVNIMGIQQDLDNGVTLEAIKLKMKYFGGCR